MNDAIAGRAQPILTGARLTLEPLAPEHTEGLVEMFADPRTSRYFSVDFSDEKAARNLVARRLADEGPPELGYWAWLMDVRVIGLGHLQPARDLPSEWIDFETFKTFRKAAEREYAQIRFDCHAWMP